MWSGYLVQQCALLFLDLYSFFTTFCFTLGWKIYLSPPPGTDNGNTNAEHDAVAHSHCSRTDRTATYNTLAGTNACVSVPACTSIWVSRISVSDMDFLRSLFHNTNPASSKPKSVGD